MGPSDVELIRSLARLLEFDDVGSARFENHVKAEVIKDETLLDDVSWMGALHWHFNGRRR